MRKKIYIIIPIYNEARVIKKVITELRRHGYNKIIVVDDGSSDNGYNRAKELSVIVLRHKLNRGKGAAIKTGMEAARSMGADIVVSFDGDGQHDPKDIKTMILKIDKGYDVVLGSRFLKRRDIPVWKRIGNICANVITFLIFGLWVSDSQSGLRIYNKNAYVQLSKNIGDRYQFDTQVLWKIKKLSLRYCEIPMNVRYTKYSQQKENKQTLFSAITTMFHVLRNA